MTFTAVKQRYENASKAAETGNSVYGADTGIVNYVQFWFRRFRSGIFDKDAPHTGRPVVENADKITEIIEVDRPFSSPGAEDRPCITLKSFAQSWIHKEARCLVPYKLTPKNMMDRISIYEALAKRNEIDPFLKRMVTGDEKWVTYDNIVQK
ncbi:histone-lysine N-methyltransferase SETMAR [Trichonephila clavipes]|nr:histone-lysine N-methyltransferase SETMAR [Trichonephila clavipes]